MTVVDRLREAVQRWPNRPAIEFDGEVTTYRELGAGVESVARALGGSPGPVAVCIEPSPLSIVSYWGVLAAGRPVVPLSTSSSAGHLASIVDAAGITTCLVSERTARTALPVTVRVLTPGALVADGRTAGRGNAPATVDTAYVLFTSGSTGRPKGVVIEHGSVEAYCDAAGRQTGITVGDRASHMFDMTFDLAVFDMVTTLTHGATLVIPTPAERRNPVVYVNNRELSHWYSVPSVVTLVRQTRLLSRGCMPGLRLSIFAGEALQWTTAMAWHEAAPGSRIANAYGPTEMTVSCTYFELPGEAEAWPTALETVPIGPPNGGVETILRDESRAGALSEGELCVRGPQRLRSYLDPADNADRFVDDTGQVVETERARGADRELYYRTGDIVRRSGGGFVYGHRLDRQVKVSGYRVDLDAIEHTLRRLPGVDDVAVVTVTNRLGLEVWAFATGDGQEAQIRRLAAAQSAPHMVPRRVVKLERLPLNDRGKVDYQALATSADRQVGAVSGSSRSGILRDHDD